MARGLEVLGGLDQGGDEQGALEEVQRLFRLELAEPEEEISGLGSHEHDAIPYSRRAIATPSRSGTMTLR